jgi:hypothetical protein
MDWDREHQGLQVENNVHDAVPNRPVLENCTVFNSIEVHQALHAISDEPDCEEDNTSPAESLVETDDMYMCKGSKTSQQACTCDVSWVCYEVGDMRWQYFSTKLIL